MIFFKLHSESLVPFHLKSHAISIECMCVWVCVYLD